MLPDWTAFERFMNELGRTQNAESLCHVESVHGNRCFLGFAVCVFVCVSVCVCVLCVCKRGEWVGGGGQLECYVRYCAIF